MPLPTATELLLTLSRHQGAGAGIRAQDLAAQLQAPERHVRKLVSELRAQGTAICAHPSTGYFVPVTPEELQQSCEFLEHRALKSLMLMSRMQNVSLPTLLGQLALKQS
jgi:biotin operon repressor